MWRASEFGENDKEINNKWVRVSRSGGVEGRIIECTPFILLHWKITPRRGEPGFRSLSPAFLYLFPDLPANRLLEQSPAALDADAWVIASVCVPKVYFSLRCGSVTYSFTGGLRVLRLCFLYEAKFAGSAAGSCAGLSGCQD